MLEPFVTPEAEAEIEEILFFISDESSYEMASLVARDLAITFDLLALMPGLGRNISEIQRGLRLRPGHGRAKNFLVYYRVVGSELQIVRVIHGARDQEALF